MSAHHHHTANIAAPAPWEGILHLETGTLLRVLIHSAGELLWRAFKTVGVWRERAKQRRDLEMLDHRLLRDIGLTREQARLEFRKPFWWA